MKIPSEIPWLSFFQAEPQLLDEDAPYYYNQVKYEFTNGNHEKFIMTMTPSYSELKLEVFNSDTKELLGLLDLKNVEAIEILGDRKEEKRIMITSPYGVIKIDLAPKYKIFINQLLVD
ncbi:hypothetical protein [Natronincola ferrireducens]|uniref:Uncharacterized protein n=1 Tax=Natronincola ferrireducens TaxID=393762 RepID=A0A1G9GFK6_9FIRM|nr:hypothetical protein [Natronincola ferrireducens]SDK99417.1 hypothetical protein SAMN05660472_02406 [Natronincola ferrireducens]